MLPDIGATELLVIAVVALIVVGPKDLPMLLRKLGEFMAKLRSMANDFRSSFDEMARQSELDDLRKQVEAMRRGQLDEIAQHAGGAEITGAFEDLNQSMADAGVALHPQMSYEYNELSTPEVETAAPKPPKRPPAKPKASAASAAKAPAKPRSAARKPRPIVDKG